MLSPFRFCGLSLRRCIISACIGVGLFIVTAGLAGFFLPREVLTVDSGAVTADVLVVLGGGLRERPERAAELFKAGAAPRIICTGSGDAGINRNYLTNAGVPATAIELEPAARSTRDNARFTIALLRAQHCRRAIIVTSWYHSRRALACFEHYAPDLQFYSRPAYFSYTQAEWNYNGISGYIKAEYVKMAGYWLCYGVWPLFT